MSRTASSRRPGESSLRNVLPADGVACGTGGSLDSGCGSGCGTGGHCRLEWLPLVRLGTDPFRRYLPIALSVHETPDSEPACVVPPTPSISDADGKRLRTSRLPVNGVAPSSVSSIISTGTCTCRPMTCTGVDCLARQVRQGALNHALPQVRNGASAAIASLSRRQVSRLLGHRASVQTVPRYIA